jgi:phospholipid/cholesterol/gamma-HCH transport system substrate-binding protein
MRRLRALVALVLGAVLLTGCDFDVYQLPLPGGTSGGSDPITVTAQFRDVLDLVPKSTVKVNDVSVGQVTDIELDGYTAEVTLQLRNDTELPDNAIAEIRQTSLLGEKFVSLSAPAQNPSADPLKTGDVISLDRTGRNPEVEEVLGALSLLLNGGGVAQLKTIADELNHALEGREGSARSVLDQVRTLVTQLDDNKADIVDAIGSLNRLAVSVRTQQGTIDDALEQLPSALLSLDKQRDDLVRMLKALDRLSDVGVRVISLSKASTIESVQQLDPVLTQLANSGDDFVKSFNVFLTYPFVDEVVGRDPQVARNLHMGDYTNLSIELDVDLRGGLQLPGLPDPGEACIPLGQLPDLPQLPPLDQLCQGAVDQVQACLANPSPTNPACTGIITDVICANQPGNPLCDVVADPVGGLTRLQKCLQTRDPTSKACEPFTLERLKRECQKPANGDQPLCRILNLVPSTGGGGLGGTGLPSLPGLGRAGFGAVREVEPRGPTVRQLMNAYDPALVSLLVPGMVVR